MKHSEWEDLGDDSQWEAVQDMQDTIKATRRIKMELDNLANEMIRLCAENEKLKLKSSLFTASI